jgi:hypothetical protein
MHPRTGGRVILELDSVSDSARYRALLYTPDTLYRGAATVALADGTVELGGWDADPPAWLVDLARKFLRTEWRARQPAGAAPWPARISRWRAER